MVNCLADAFREALKALPRKPNSPPSDQDRVPLATNDEANKPIQDTELLYNPIRDTSIGH